MRDIYEPEFLRRLAAPRCVAVVGVSEKPGSFGKRTWENLARFDGQRFAVNPRYATYDGAVCYPSVEALPATPDCVVICTPAAMVESVLRECVARGVCAAIVFASGYAELGTEPGRQAQERLRRIAKAGGVLLLGPNCMGSIHAGSRAGLTFSPAVDLGDPAGHSVALVSQSGAIGFALLQASHHGTAFSHMLTSGNACDVDVADQIAYLAQDDSCHGIALVFESIAHPARLIEAGRRARRAGKPVVVYKVARTEEGGAAAMSHTGALAGSDAAYRAAFVRAGMVLVDDIEHLLETTVFLAKSARLPRPSPGVAVITASGGLGIMAADKATEVGVALPQPGPQVTKVLAARIPSFGSPRNPCDVTAQVVNDLGSLAECSEALLSDPSYGALVHPHTGAHEAGTERLRVLERAAAAAGKMACIVWSTAWLEGPGASEVERMSHAALFRSMGSCARALAARNWLHAGEIGESSAPPLLSPEAVTRARRIVLRASGDTLTEVEGLSVLHACGIGVTPYRVVDEAASAAREAQALGLPVAMKIVSRDVPHKTDAGGVVLNVRTAEQASRAFDGIMSRVRAACPAAALDGVVIQPMAPAGFELILGARRDPVFGALVVIGVGGVLVELLQDAAVGLAPCTPAEAERMLRSLKAARLLDGFRGHPSVDVPALAQVVTRFSECIAALGPLLEEVDVNPLICRGDQILAVDALVRRASTKANPEDTSPTAKISSRQQPMETNP